MSISTIPEARLRQGFDYFDKDKSGTIEVTELSALFKWLDVDVAANNLSAKVWSYLQYEKNQYFLIFHIFNLLINFSSKNLTLTMMEN